MDQNAAGDTAFGGTFNGNPFSLAAAQVTLDELRRSPAPIASASSSCKASAQPQPRAASRSPSPASAPPSGSHFTTRRDYCNYLDGDRSTLQRFLRAILDSGTGTLPDGRVFVSAVHTAAEADRILAARSVLTGMA